MSFLFFESVFGICGGCNLYEKIFHKKSYYCSGGTCEVKIKEKIQETSVFQKVILFLFLIIFISIIYLNKDNFKNKKNSLNNLQNNTSCNIQNI